MPAHPPGGNHPAPGAAAALFRRYDRRALRVALPPPWGAGLSGVPPLASRASLPAWQRALVDWCWQGASAAPAERPGAARQRFWQRPAVERPFGIALLRVGEDAARCAAALRSVEALSREFDGDAQLRASTRMSGLLLRLRVKLQEAMWWRSVQPGDCWDCGYVGWDEEACAHMAAFVPRRPTLLVAVRLPADRLQRVLAALQARPQPFAFAVRLLVVGSEMPGGPAAPGGLQVFEA
jgi:hypothetical protein